MGKYMKKSKVTSDVVAVMEVTSGVCTRAKTLALQRLRSLASPNPDATSTCYLQLRSRRLEKTAPETKKTPTKEKGVNFNCKGASRLRMNSSATTGDTECETEDFDAVKEASFGDNCFDFDRYNFDIVNDLPLSGRYEWVQVLLSELKPWKMFHPKICNITELMSYKLTSNQNPSFKWKMLGTHLKENSFDGDVSLSPNLRCAHGGGVGQSELGLLYWLVQSYNLFGDGNDGSVHALLDCSAESYFRLQTLIRVMPYSHGTLYGVLQRLPHPLLYVQHRFDDLLDSSPFLIFFSVHNFAFFSTTLLKTGGCRQAGYSTGLQVAFALTRRNAAQDWPI
ncbi:unnamed protein product [Dovyalis caffra]|uniref:Cyclin-dependent kinase inhibitor domain-containing protein n=1 Tax=Dovyalis caffra TaxID=77055 RepID=A0AAV1SDJ9_9ROSI|nr:unnamed protein product [Dovyalis caffra]